MFARSFLNIMSGEMELGEKTFPSGRHRNKTYLWVFENDKEFCEMVINGERSRFIPDDFIDFLRTKMEDLSLPRPHSLAQQDVKSFVKAFDDEMRRQFRREIGKFHMKVEEIHSKTNIELSNGFLGIFYRIFVQKHVSNITNTDVYSEYLTNYEAIFPFPVSEELQQRDIDVLNVIDDKLLDEMQTFLDEHYEGVEIRSICKKFFTNILNCKEKNVPEKAIVEAVKDLNLIGLPANNGGDKNVNDDEECEYLKSYPRVNDSGVRRYRKMYDMIVDVTELYDKPCNVQAFKYEDNYLLKLPEINFYELYSLLNVDFLHSDRLEYLYRFKKYLFFFINALKHPSKPVFFIDDGLYECLLHYNTFKKSRDDVETLKFELSMLTLVFRRGLGFDENRETFCLDDDNLKDVQNYFDNRPDIANALVFDEIHTEILTSVPFVSNDRIAMDVCFRSKRCWYIENFFELIIYAALSPKRIERLVIYNAFRGEETSISMPLRKDAIVQFIRKYNNYNSIQTFWPEEFLTRGYESCYQGDIRNWDSKKNFKFQIFTGIVSHQVICSRYF